ncbi:hypothetical protein ACFE04_015169 [Oxalis oulophora]
MLVAIEPSKEERKVKDLDELSAMSKIKSMLVSFNHVRGHATPIDVNDKDIDRLVLVIVEELEAIRGNKIELIEELNGCNIKLVTKFFDFEAVCVRVETDASSSMQLVTERDQALGVARFDMAAMS